MQLYKRYFLKKIASYFVAIATILICLIWFTKTVSFIKYITENGIKFSEFLYIFVLVLPWLVLLIIPISL
ncbi:MAG: LptF/LptG family permease, partial [Proteobacteria bacterium]|nr:LptF/LptG family permease [Pseudomonadota bacterium]